MNLLRIDIIENREVTKNQNALQFIGRAEQSMFLEYNKKLNGAIYLIKKDSWKYIQIELETYGIDFKILSNHRITI